MSKRAWRAIGIGLFWLLWPALIVYINRSERARILVVHGDELLLVKPWLGAGSWGLPGGGLHPGEPVLDACLRELREETGISLQKAQVKNLFSGTYKERGFRYRCHYFVAELSEKLLVTTQRLEIAEYAWVNRHKLNPKTCQSDTLTTVTAWFET
ncbi:MAG TPA: NUDIX hydrolase [Candidatus Saccharimonadales bacterium]|nr:NUDIX hydrolase [Candidatus Saccharimonadales bacterium]